MKTAYEEWEALREEMSERIAGIDRRTPWRESEPLWWLEMMAVQKALEKAAIKTP